MSDVTYFKLLIQAYRWTADLSNILHNKKILELADSGSKSACYHHLFYKRFMQPGKVDMSPFQELSQILQK